MPASKTKKRASKKRSLKKEESQASHIWGIAIPVLAVLALLGGIYAYNALVVNPPTEPDLVPIEELADPPPGLTPASEVGDWEESTSTYRHDVIGVNFTYPQTWGEPYTDPSRNITDLSTVVEGRRESNGYYHNVQIRFTDPHRTDKHGEPNGRRFAPVVKIFDEQYPGESFPNAAALGHGYMDNIPTLKETGDICDYERAFDARPDVPYTTETIAEYCENGIKTILYVNHHGTNNYFLGLYTYKRLQNGEMNHLLANYTLRQHVREGEVTSIQEYFRSRRL